jgi:hypothetical protein
MRKIRESWHDDPSEEEIARLAAQIRETWSDREKLSRANCRSERMTVTTVSIERQNPRPVHW